MPTAFDALERLESNAEATASLLKLLANRQRLILLRHMAESECSVNELAAYTGLSQSAASQHLARLRAHGVVSTRRDAQTVWYRLRDPQTLRLIGSLCDIIPDHAPEQR